MVLSLRSGLCSSTMANDFPITPEQGAAMISCTYRIEKLLLKLCLAKGITPPHHQQPHQHGSPYAPPPAHGSPYAPPPVPYPYQQYHPIPINHPQTHQQYPSHHHTATQPPTYHSYTYQQQPKPSTASHLNRQQLQHHTSGSTRVDDVSALQSRSNRLEELRLHQAQIQKNRLFTPPLPPHMTAPAFNTYQQYSNQYTASTEQDASMTESYVDDKRKDDVRQMNIIAARSVVDAVRTSLGPKGLDKKISATSGDVTITSDGATILNKMEVLQPAATMLVELSKSQDVVAGDGINIGGSGRVLEKQNMSADVVFADSGGKDNKLVEAYLELDGAEKGFRVVDSTAREDREMKDVVPEKPRECDRFSDVIEDMGFPTQSIHREDDLEDPLGLSAPSTKERVVVMGIAKRKVLSSGVPVNNKEKLADQHSSEISQSRRPKFGSRDESPHMIDGSINDGADVGDMHDRPALKYSAHHTFHNAMPTPEHSSPFGKSGELSVSKDVNSGEEEAASISASLSTLIWSCKVAGMFDQALMAYDQIGVIKRNSKAKEPLMESEVEALKEATSLQEVFPIASLVTATYVFLCAHGSRDKRCGVYGPVLLEKLKEGIGTRDLQEKGYYQSIRPTQMGLTLNIDVSARAFYEPILVTDFIAKYCIRDIRKPLTDQDRIKVEKALKGLKVTVTHREQTRSYKVSGITSQTTCQLVFPMGGTGTQTSLVQYYRERYNITLQYVWLPCIQAGNDKRRVDMPMEICKIVEGQRFSKNLNEKQVTNLLRATCQRPVDREKTIKEMVAQSHFSDDFVKDFIGFATVENGTCVSLAKLHEDAVHRFCHLLIEMCCKRGMIFDKRPVIPVRSAHPGPIERILTDIHRESNAKKRHLQLLLTILPETTGSYPTIKRVCETKLGIVSQCCQPGQALKCNNQYMENVAMKINVKVGGRNVVLVDAPSRRIPLVSNAQKVLDEMLKLNTEVVPNQYSVVMVFRWDLRGDGCWKHFVVEKNLVGVVKEFAKCGVFMNSDWCCYSTLTDGFCKGDGMCRNERIGNAMELLKELQQSGVNASAVTYPALITSICNVNNMETARGLIGKMMGSECKSDAVVYHTFFSGLTLCGKMTKASAVASRMKDAEFLLDLKPDPGNRAAAGYKPKDFPEFQTNPDFNLEVEVVSDGESIDTTQQDTSYTGPNPRLEQSTRAEQDKPARPVRQRIHSTRYPTATFTTGSFAIK